MSGAPAEANVVIIGAGIVGNGLAWHLAQLGETRLVLVDKGPLPNPGGSTGHASNFLFPFEHSQMMMQLTRDSVEQYKALGVFTESGGIEVARTETRMQEFRRKQATCKAWDIESQLLTPEEIKKLVPFINDELLVGGLSFPTTGVVDSLRAGTIMRERAQAMGALTVVGNVEVLGIDVADGRVQAVRTDAGTIRTERVVVCCGVWSPRVARMAGAHLPLTPAVHQMVSVGPIGLFAGTEGEISYPIVRDVDTFMYERQHGADMEVGSYAHRPILVDPDDIPSIAESALSPTELPFTSEDFDPQLADALELMPELLGDEKAGVRYAINGLISLTPDGHPLLGESPEVRGLWAAAASWIKEAPGIARAVAEWMVVGHSELDIHEADLARFYPHQRTRAHVRARADEAFNKTYGIVHPAEQWQQSRGLRRSPVHAQTQALGAVYFEAAGWDRPHWYQSNEALVGRYADRIAARPAEWDARWYSPIVEAEHLAMRDGAGLVDLGAFCVFDVTGRGALDFLNRVAVAQVDVPVGKVVYTPFLDEEGGLRADVTVMRLGPSSFRVVTGAGVGMLDRQWLVDHLPDDGSAHLADATSGWATVGLWGPRARDVLSTVTTADVSHAGFPYGTCRWIEVGDLDVLASRISYVGELGWELYVPAEYGPALWERLQEAGAPHGVVPVGIGVYGSTARIEKGYRSYGHELTPDYTPREAGLERKLVKRQAFIGKAAHLAERSTPPAATLCTLSVDYTGVDPGERRYPLGHESVVSADGEPLVDRKGRRSFVTSAAAGPSVGSHLLLAYLPTPLAVAGARLQVECMGERYPVTVEVAGNGAVFDPGNERMRA
ncbi:FAD-dependent oxidoreductase [Acidimicrobiaceae bacterium USS-CC1]|uniref:FAD-dependent oxidoreductase n=1 Tax=Acidiferrimicrobium australe TaxID=2664430 RepID=A0ABW9QQF3_9ACTN|nr:FAD-dependent oxidoreductase [Acidiferrimicrobium australe]